MIISVPEEAFSIGVLNREYHDRLLVDLDKVVETAGIPPSFVWTRMSEYCKDEDVDWLKSMKRSDDFGLVFVNKGYKVKSAKPVTDRMMAIAGACLRNYIDARVIPLQDVLQRLKDGNMPSPTVLLIPNFCLNNNDGGHIAPWQISELLGLLLSRMAKNLKTVVYVDSLDVVEKAYGETFRQHFESHFAIA